MSSELIKHVTDTSFQADVLQSDTPVLVDFWAEWCGPCKAIAPILDEVSQTYGTRLQVTKVNIDDNQQVPGKYGIRSIPTLMLFKNGEAVGTKIGLRSKADLTSFIDAHL
jgi:thioredoxin 1